MKHYFTKIIILLLFTGCSAPGEIKIDINKFYKPGENPIVRADSAFTFMDPIKKEMVRWQAANVFNPAAIVKDGKVFLLYRCEDNPAAGLGQRTSRLGLAESDDGIHFTKNPEPVLYPDSSAFMQYDYPGGCEDPRLVQTEDSLYVVIYTSWNYKIPRLAVAFSKDLVHWEKKGPALAKAYNGKFLDEASKSASIITKISNGRQVAAKINGKYWMYWGEHLINLAWSDNLYDWNPLLNEKGELKAAAAPRPGKFDSNLTECGPPAIITDRGIELFYNGRNATDDSADPALPRGTYSVGRIIFDKNDPGLVIERLETCFLKPDLPYEISGQYKAGTTFAEGLVFFKEKWFLYYGTADSFVGVAISPK